MRLDVQDVAPEPLSPTIGVVIPTFNNPLQALLAVKSVLRQTDPVQEIVVVDDNSDANNLADLRRRIDELPTSSPVNVIALDRNVGPGAARHIGANSTSTDYVAFLDADDQWHFDKVRLCRKAIAETGACIAGHGRGWAFDISEEFLVRPLGPIKVELVPRRAFFLRNPLPTSSIVAAKELARTMFRFGGRRAEDYMALMVATTHHPMVVFLSEDLCWAGKPPFGHSGEGANQMEMYWRSATNTWSLTRAGHVAPAELALFLAVLVLKVPRGLIQSLRYRRLSNQSKDET